MLRKGLLGFSICSWLLLMGFMSFVIYSNKAKPEIIDDLFVKREVSQVSSPLPEREFNIPFKTYIESRGVVVPSAGYIRVQAPLEGYVKRLFVSLGDRVRKNDALFKICDNSIQVEIKEKEARLNRSIAQLKFLQQGPSKFAQVKIQKEIEEIEIRKVSQEKEVSIFEGLLEKSAVSSIENEEKNMFLQITEKQLEKANAELDELNAKMSSKEEDIYLSAIDEKKATLKLSALKLERSLVKTPGEGNVVDVALFEGQYLKDKEQGSITIALGSPSLIKVSINENDAYKISNVKNLRAVAVHPTNPAIYFVLDFVSCNPRMSIYKNAERKLDVYFSFQKENAPLYLEQSLKVYIETSNLKDLSFLHYQVKESS